MSDKVIRHYSRPYGDCRADKRLYFGGSWPWQQGAECSIAPTIEDNLGVVDVSNISYDSPTTIYRSSGGGTFELVSWLGETLTVTSIDAPAGDTIGNTFPLTLSDINVATISYTGSTSGDFTIHHNGLNSPFIVSLEVAS